MGTTENALQAARAYIMRHCGEDQDDVLKLIDRALSTREHRDVWLIWQTIPGTRMNDIRAIDEDEETVRGHRVALESESRITREGSKFYVEKVVTNHLYGHGALTAISAAMRGSQ